MGRAKTAAVRVEEHRNNLPPPAPLPGPVRPDTRRSHCIVLNWVLDVAWATATLARSFATAFLELYLVGALQLAAMRRRPGAQPMVVEVPGPYAYGAHFGAPLRTTYRLRFGPALWSLLMIVLIAMSFTRGPIATDLSICSLPPKSHVPVGQTARTVLDQVVASNAEALACAGVVGRNVAVVGSNSKDGPHESICATFDDPNADVHD